MPNESTIEALERILYYADRFVQSTDADMDVVLDPEQDQEGSLVYNSAKALAADCKAVADSLDFEPGQSFAVPSCIGEIRKLTRVKSIARRENGKYVVFDNSPQGRREVVFSADGTTCDIRYTPKH